MFNVTTLLLHVFLLVLLYLFIFFTIRTINQDIKGLTKTSSVTDNDFILDKSTIKDNIYQSDVFVEIISGPQIGLKYAVLDEVLIGRSDDCDIVLEDSFVSAHHARIYRANAEYWLEDLMSTNGTLIDDIAIDVPVCLKNNTKFTIGQNTFIFKNTKLI